MSNRRRSVASKRIHSIDALRGFIMLTMIFVNDLGLIGGHTVPDWLVHFSDRSKGSGMTFVDLVLPAFVFIVGMSIPFSIGLNNRKGKTHAQIVGHILARTLSLLVLGVIYVNGWPSTLKMGWSAPLWETLTWLCAIFAFCQISPPNPSSINAKTWARVTLLLRSIGFTGLIALVWLFVGKQDNHIITLSPVHISTQWWGILGIIGWAYFIAAILYLVFQNHRTALLGCMVLLLCLFPAATTDLFKESWLAHYMNIGAILGSHPAIAVAGMLLSTILVTPETQSLYKRICFTNLFILAMILGALLLNGLYGISKNHATPSWVLWSCAVTAGLWLIFHLICDVKPFEPLSKPLTLAGNNVLLTYLLSSMYFPILVSLGLSDEYRSFGQMDLTHALLRALSMSVLLTVCTVALNRVGFRLKI